MVSDKEFSDSKKELADLKSRFERFGGSIADLQKLIRGNGQIMLKGGNFNVDSSANLNEIVLKMHNLTFFLQLDTLNEDSYKDSTLIMQLLRDNLTVCGCEFHLATSLILLF